MRICKSLTLSAITVVLSSLLAPGGASAATNILYETFADSEIVGISTANPGIGVGVHIGNATNVVAGGGKVYWEDGLNIWSANPDLTGASIIHTNGLAPTDLGLYVFPPPVAPGPVPGAGLVSLAFLFLVSATAKARGFLGR